MSETPASGSPRPGGVDHLRTIVGHHTWAMLTLIVHCQRLSAEELRLSTPGTLGTVHETLAHLVSADHRYLRGITGEEARPRPPAPPPITTLLAHMEGQADRWRELLCRIDELDATLPASEDYPEIEHALGLFLVQAVHHGNEHRAHVCSVLGAHGLEVPDLSGWEYILALRTASGEGSPLDDPDGNEVEVIAPA